MSEYPSEIVITERFINHLNKRYGHTFFKAGDIIEVVRKAGKGVLVTSQDNRISSILSIEDMTVLLK